jgi:UPF0755 protein
VAIHLKHGRLKLALALLVIAAAVFAAMWWQRTLTFAERGLALAPQAQPRVLMIDRGDGFNAVLGKLRGLGVAQGSDLEWKLLARKLGVAGKLQVGEYEVPAGITPDELLRRLGAGEVIQRKFTIVEGWNFRDLRNALAAEDRLRPSTQGLDDAALMAKLGRKGTFPEGRFLPETYVFTRGADDLSILDRAAKAMDDALREAWDGRDADLPLANPDELLTLASIVEKETGLASERPQIAGVFVRRLRLGMRLETDPTVIYGIGAAYDGNIRKKDLLADNPYNTYQRGGLPPTPIAMPGKAALQAAAHPAPGDTLFFVARGNGAHHFSATYAEHAAAVRRYQLRR